MGKGKKGKDFKPTPLKQKDIDTELKINDIVNQKIDVPEDQTLTYFPITGVIASSQKSGHGPTNTIDSNPDSYWEASDQVAGAYIEYISPGKYTAYGIDVKFKETENKKYNLKIDALDYDNNRWITLATAESSIIDEAKYERFVAAQQLRTDTVRIIVNSIFDVKTGHMYTQPKITQVRIYGLVPTAEVKKYRKDITKDDDCPAGYAKDFNTGLCVKQIPSEVIMPTGAEAHSNIDMGAETPAGNKVENLLTLNPNDKLTLRGSGSSITYNLNQKADIHGVYIWKLNNPPREYTVTIYFYHDGSDQPFYTSIVDIPPSTERYIHFLNTPLNADKFKIVCVSSTHPQLYFSLMGLYLIGKANGDGTTQPPPVEPPTTGEPPKPNPEGEFQAKGASMNPHKWEAVPMNEPTDGNTHKVIDVETKINAAHKFISKKNAEDFIKYWMWQFDHGVHVGPPIVTEPPVEPPIEPTKPPATGNKASNGVVIMAEIDPTGEEVKDFTIARSVHNQSNEKNIQRDSIYAKPNKMSKTKNVNKATYGYIQAWLTASDQWDFKDLGGRHSGGNVARQGRCLAVGFQVNKGKVTTGFLAKECEQHSNTPKFENKIKYANPNWTSLPDINGKTIGLQVVYSATKNNTVLVEVYVDRSVMDKNVMDLVEAPNKWELFFTAEDKGDWIGEPYLTNQGIANGGDAMFLYGRLDHVSIDPQDSKKPTTKAKFCGAISTKPRA